MRSPVVVLTLVLVALPLAGCLGGDDDASAPATGPNGAGAGGAPRTDGDAATDGIGRTPATWAVGDWWTYTFTGGQQTTYVVIEDTGEDWVIGTTNEAIAFFHAQNEISTMGPQRKGDLAGSQGEARVVFFDWPMRPGKSWATTWDGVERRVTVTQLTDTHVHLQAEEGGHVAVRYSYHAEAGWFDDFDFFDENGTETFGAELTDWGTAFQGTIVSWRLIEHYRHTEAIPTSSPQGHHSVFNVGDEATDLYLRATVTCAQGAWSLLLTDGSGQERTELGGACPTTVQQDGVVHEGPAPGQWTLDVAGIDPSGTGTQDVVLWERTRLETVIG